MDGVGSCASRRRRIGRSHCVRVWRAARAIVPRSCAIAWWETRAVLARRFVSWIESDDRFVLVAPVPFSTVCFRGRWPGLSEEEEDAANELLVARVSAAGPVFLAPTRLSGRVTLRLAIGNLRTEEKHVRQAFDLLVSLHDESGRDS